MDKIPPIFLKKCLHLFKNQSSEGSFLLVILYSSKHLTGLSFKYCYVVKVHFIFIKRKSSFQWQKGEFYYVDSPKNNFYLNIASKVFLPTIASTPNPFAF